MSSFVILFASVFEISSAKKQKKSMKPYPHDTKVVGVGSKDKRRNGHTYTLSIAAHTTLKHTSTLPGH